MTQTESQEVAPTAGSEPAADFKKSLMDQVRAAGGTQAIDTKQLFQKLVKETLEALLELEMEEHLGYSKHDPAGRGSGNSRNGAGGKTVRGDFGEIEIETPRDRNSSFEPKIVAKRQTSIGNFNEAVISLYARGMTTREIEQHIKEMYGVEISPQFVSRATEELQQQITEWQSRPLERVYPIIFVDGLRVAVRTDKGVLIRQAGSTRLVDRGNRRGSLLAQGLQRSQSPRPARRADRLRRWIDRLAQCRGIGLSASRCAALRRPPYIRNVTKFVSYKDRRSLCAAMRPIYTAPTVEAAELALDRFAQSWEARYPASVAAWRNHWNELTTFFKYPVELRRMIYTTNAIESLHSQMRKNVANRKVFPNDEALIKILFLNLRNFANRWTKRQGWDIVMNQLMMIFGDRLKPDLVDSL
jgi:transposase-like protein